jgi:DNA-binding MarR family transcriptional regulator
MNSMEQSFFYTIEKSIKTYRQFAQRKLLKEGFDVTIDQWLVLQTISGDKDINREQISLNVFKDEASVTRIIDLLIKKNYLRKEPHNEDSRRFSLVITDEGYDLLKRMESVILRNRATALKGISAEELSRLKDQLDVIINNCKNAI